MNANTVKNYIKKGDFKGLSKKIRISMSYRICKLQQRLFWLFTQKKSLSNTIIIESHNDFDCNGGKIYDLFINNGVNRKYKIIWLVKKINRIKLPYNVVQYKIFGISAMKNYYISRAKLFFCDDVITKKVRPDQVVFYCTHGGCTFKNVKGLINVCDYVDYVLSPSINYDRIMINNYSIANTVKMLHFGFPKNDDMFTPNNEINKVICKKYDKTILWMPTFRKNREGRNDSDVEDRFAIPLFTEEKELLQLDELLVSNSVLLLIKLHPFQDVSNINRMPALKNIKIMTGEESKELDINVYKLMNSVDALISDYSSAAYSFILLDKPLGFVLSDIDNYKLGFVDNPPDNYLPGSIIYNYDELSTFIINVIDGVDIYKNQRNDLLDWMYEHHDGKATERLYDFAMNLEVMKK